MIKDYQKGLSIKELEKKYNTSSGMIYYKFKKLGIPNRGKRVPYKISIYKKEDMKIAYNKLYSNTNLYLNRKKEDLFRLISK